MQDARENNKNHNLSANSNMVNGRDSASNASVASSGQLEKLPFQLQSGEKIIRELKPQFKGFMLTRVLWKYISLVILSIGIIIVGILTNKIPLALVADLVAVPLLIFIISIGPIIEYGKSWYWITTHRVIGKNGFFGYNIDSIPLENISDVVLSRTLLDRILGLSSLIIVPMGGSRKTNGGVADETTQNANFFPALPQNLARELQRTIFNLRDELKKTQAVQAPYGTTSKSSESAQPLSHLPRGTK